MHKKNDSRVFVFGAGVSKAVAGAPVMKELFSEMKNRYEDAKKIEDSLVRNSLTRDFVSIETLINELEAGTTRAISHSKGGQGISMEDGTGIRENIEWFITLIDISTDYAPKLDLHCPGADVSPFSINPFQGVSRSDMKHVRGCLSRYLYLCLCNLKEMNDSLKKFSEKLQPDDHLITFNYDVLIENALLENDKWSPVGGYVGVEELESRYKSEGKLFRGSSPHKILKLHGSINWVKGGVVPLDINKPPLITLHKWDSNPFFPKYEKILGQKPSGSFPTWILPSYFKVFGENPFLFTVWREAQRIFTQTKRLVVLGYSFPEEDFLSQLLLASLPDNCSILIVDKEPDEIKDRMNHILRSPDISVQGMGFEEWVKKGCPEPKKLGGESAWE